jgi:hypothetical protein
MCSISLIAEIKKQIEKYCRHCLWRVGDVNAKKPPLAAWKLVTRPKMKGGLVVLNLNLHNDVLLMKHLHKFFSKEDLPWVKLLWHKYYRNGKLLKKANRGSFWWKGIMKHLDTFKGIASTSLGSRDMILFWDDMWNGQILRITYPELHSFAIDNQISVKSMIRAENLYSMFHLPLSAQAFEQYCDLELSIQSLTIADDKDSWSYIWGGSQFSVSKAYNHLIGTHSVHPAFKWLWKSSCQQKHKVFYWLLLQNRLNTRGHLRRRRMYLDSYTCDLCILQKQETLRHLFFRCSFAKLCW